MLFLIMKRVHFIVEGRVQGVFYRINTRKRAYSLDLKGYVKNLLDGTVEVVAEGSEENLKKLIEWCRSGSPAANVTNIKAEWKKPKGEFSEFSIKY